MADFDINVTGTIANGSVTNSKLADVPVRTIKGRDVGGTGSPKDLTADEASDVLDLATNPFARTSYVDDLVSSSAASILNQAETFATNEANGARQGAIDEAAIDATAKANAAQAAAIAASQPLDSDLTAYANAADAAARRALIGAGTGSGDVVGPASATDNAIARMDLTTGKLIQNSGITIADGATGTLSGTNTGDQTSVTGNAGTATALQTSRNIDGQAFNGTADITVIAPGTNAATSKTTPIDADELPLVDSAASNVLKKLTWANLKATLKTYFDGLYSTPFAPTFLTYSGGSQAYAVTTLAAVNSTTFTFPSTGFYHVQYNITHDANATTTGANFSVAGTAVSDYFNAVITYRVDTSTAGRSAFALSSFASAGAAGLPAQSSFATTNNRVSVDIWINVTTVGDISLLAASEVAVANGITVTAVTGFMKKEY